MSSRWRPAILSLAMLAGIAMSGCRATYVVVPAPAGQYTRADTLYAIHRGNELRVTFHFDTIMWVDTVTRVDTAWVRGSRTIVRVDTVRVPVRERVVRVDTILRVDTVRVPVRERVVRVDTILRVDTVRVPVRQTITRVDTILRVDTVRVPTRQTITRVDTVLRVDTVRVRETIARVDTVRVVVRDTVFRTVTVPGRRMLFVPPGHYPPEGQCRVWIAELPPGRQAKPVACNALGNIPPGAFVLFGGNAWDIDYDWIAEAEAKPGTVPPEIIALKRKNRK